MSNFAAVLARRTDGWVGTEVDLADVPDLDGLVELIRDVREEEGAAGPGLLLMEEDDEWYAIVRLDGDVEPRILLSDRRVTASSGLAAALFADAPVDLVTPADPDEEDAPTPPGEPGGDADVLADLGTPRERLLELTSEEGLLPGDILVELCEAAGCGPEWEALREA